MSDPILLISRDTALAHRIRQALPARVALELHCESAPAAAPDRRGWLLVVADGRAGAIAGELAAASFRSVPVIWLADPPLAPEVPFHAGVIDCLDRNEKVSKLTFVLHHHLSAAYLRRLRARPPVAIRAAVAPEDEQRNLANLLTGILGNAELALTAAARMPAPLCVRLQRIFTLAAALRDLLAGSTPLSPDLSPAVPPTTQEPDSAATSHDCTASQ